MKLVRIVIVLFMFFTFGCSTMTGSDRGRVYAPENVLTPLDYDKYGRPPVPVKILLLVPYEFEHYEHVSNHEGRSIYHLLGRDAEREMRDAFGIQFAEVEVLPVQSEAMAIQMLSPYDPENAQLWAYDYVAIPKFLRVNSIESTERYGFEIDLQVEFTAKDGSRITIRGHGESMIGKHAQSTPGKSAVLTLQYAISALLDEIERSRSFFVG